MALYLNGYALIIGAGGDLEKTIDDAKALANILIDPLRCAYPKDHVHVLTGKNATREEIFSEFTWLKSQTDSDPEASAIVYFSGHGATTNNGYYLFPNGYDTYKLNKTAISGKEFTETLGTLNVKKLVVLLDCCHAGGITRIKAFRKTAIPPEFTPVFTAGQGRIVIASSHDNEYSYVGEKLSYFTTALIEALNGCGVSSGDGYVRVSDLVLWIARRVPQLSHQKQNPDLSFAHLDNFALSFYAGGNKKQVELPSEFFSVVNNENQTFNDPNIVDFLIITTHSEERDAILSKLSRWHKLPPSNDDIRFYYQSELPVHFTDGTSGIYRVIIMSYHGSGRLAAANATSDAIRRWHPRYILLVGIAGGIPNEQIQIGDIIIVDQVTDYELQKLTPEGNQLLWEIYRASPRLIEACKHMDSDSWKILIDVNRPNPGNTRCFYGPVASGDKFIALDDILLHYKRYWPTILGVEMEAGGVASAAFHSADKPEFFMVRGVSNLVYEDKSLQEVDQWRNYACDAAAAYVIALLRSGPVPFIKQSTKST
jgi:nucleoside phosphorylase